MLGAVSQISSWARVRVQYFRSMNQGTVRAGGRERREKTKGGRKCGSYTLWQVGACICVLWLIHSEAGVSAYRSSSLPVFHPQPKEVVQTIRGSLGSELLQPVATSLNDLEST